MLKVARDVHTNLIAHDWRAAGLYFSRLEISNSGAHIAFAVSDVLQARAQVLAAGGAAVGDASP